jgi:transposase
LAIVQTATQHDANPLDWLQTVPGMGKLLSLVLLYAIHAIARFPRVQDFVSYGRLVTYAKESAGKRYGPAGTRIGNASLTWAFSEAAVLLLRNNPRGQKYLARLENKHGQGKALTILAHTLARAIYDMLQRSVAFDLDAFLQG